MEYTRKQYYIDKKTFFNAVLGCAKIGLNIYSPVYMSIWGIYTKYIK